MTTNPGWDVADDAVAPTALSADGEGEAGFIGVARPRLRWRLDSARAGVLQCGHQVQSADDAGFDKGLETALGDATAMPGTADWPGAPLVSRAVRWLRVRVLTDRGATRWSEPLRVEAALLDAADWQARPISPLGNWGVAAPAPVPLLRRAFRLTRPVASARLYVTALGIHDSFINGERVGDTLLEPGWSAYQERLLYAAHDVTAMLRAGENVIAAAVGDGWWRGWLTWMERRAVYGDTTALLAQLEIRYADGTSECIGTDGDWQGGQGAILAADLYNGSTIDLRREPVGWRKPGFDAGSWEAVRALPLPVGLELRPMPPVRVIERRTIEAVRGPDGWRVDTGQNISGWLRLTASGPAGGGVTVRHAEVLDDAGELYTAPLRNAEATDRYVLAGGAAVVLEPAFTFHGFRHATIEADAGVEITAVEMVAIASDLPQIGRFACSDPRLDRLFENVRWSQLDNFLALPTDCPQRDERLGWTGDIQVFAETACTNADARRFLGGWLRDLSIEQRGDGNVPSTVPNVIGGHEFEYGGVGWGDAATLVPWAIYEAYGEPEVLAAQFDSMRRWVDYGLSRRAGDRTWTAEDFHLGDWLDPGAPADEPQKATTDPHFIATAYLGHSCRVVARAAAILGLDEAAQRYADQARAVTAAAWARWREHAVTTQAGCALAIAFAVAPEEERACVGQVLAGLVAANDGRIATGFLGTPLVLPALTGTGQVEAAYRLLLNEDCPGWLYQVARGATTMWERWDAVLPDGRLHAGEMSAGGGSSMISFNHYAYGAVATWLYQTVAGIAPDAPGYRRIRFAPQPGGGLTHAEARVDTPLGAASIAWALDVAGTMNIRLAIPPCATGSFHVPNGWSGIPQEENGTVEITSGHHTLILWPASTTEAAAS